MKKIGFIGATDKSDIIVYVAKALEQLNNKVLVIDATIMQKTKYIVPAINPTKSYITDFENVDYAVGFESMGDLEDYFGAKMNYDYILMDIDKEEAFEGFSIEQNDKNYFVSAFDIYSLQRGIELLKRLPTQMNLSKILCDYEMKKENEEYLLYLAVDTKAIWDDFTIYIPFVDENEKLLEDNQKVYRVRLKKLIPEYQDGIIYIVQDIVRDMSVGKIRKMIRE